MTNKTDTAPRLQFCDRFSGAWQQACHTVHDTVKTFFFPYDAIDSTHLPNSSMHPPVSLSSDTHQRKLPLPHNESESTVAPKTIPSANAAAVLSGDSQDAGSCRNPKQVRGSCMAIVIGLVMGIIWFWFVFTQSYWASMALEFSLHYTVHDLHLLLVHYFCLLSCYIWTCWIWWLMIWLDLLVCWFAGLTLH